MSSSSNNLGPALTRRPQAGRSQTSAARARRIAAVAFLAPAVVMLIIVRLLPAGDALFSGLFHYSLVAGQESWVGLQNYVDLFTSGRFWNSVGITLLFSIIINPLQIAIALALAVLFTQRMHGSVLWRSLVILPVAAPGAVSTIIWGVIYRPDGLANAFLGALGIPPQPYVISTGQALMSIIILLSWGGVGYWMMFLIAGINDVPRELHEAASLDGASAWRRFWRITFPLIRRPLAFVLVADTISNFLVFAPVQVLTQGGPQGSTNLLMFDIYERAYKLGDLNTANAEVVILIAITLVIVAVQFRLLRSSE